MLRDDAGHMDLTQLVLTLVAILGVLVVGLLAVVPHLLELPELRHH